MNNIISLIGFLFLLFVVVMLLSRPGDPPLMYVKSIKPWPPQIGKTFPDLELMDQDGRSFHLSEYKGKVILLEPVALNCQYSQAFSGSARKGAFRDVKPIKNVSSIADFFPEYTGGLKFPNKDIIFIQLILYGTNYQKPTLADAKAWADHFGFKVKDNQIIAVSPHDLRSNASLKIIPGFQLIDKGFVLQVDSTGARPKDDLKQILLPLVPIAIKAEKR